MMYKLAVCDSEIEYASQLVDYFSNKKGFPLQAQLFSTMETLGEYSKKQPLLMALISEKDFNKYEGCLNIENIFLLGEKQREDIKVFYKYQSSEKLTRELLLWIAKEGILSEQGVTGKGLKLIGIYSPVGKCLKTSFAFVMGQLLSKRHKVLYLNLESYSGLGKLLEKDFSTDLSELIYYLQNTKESFGCRMGGMVEQAGGLDILPPFDSYLDMISVSGEEWIRLFKEIEKSSGYEYMILDLSDAIQGLFDILRLCDIVYTLSSEDGFSRAKINQYEHVLRKSNYEDIWAKTKQYTIPKIKNLPDGLMQLTFTELAEYVKKRIEEDL